MKTTTLCFVFALVLSAEGGKLTDADKLALARADAAAAKANATLTGFVSQAQRQVQLFEDAAKKATDERDRLIADLKKKLGLDAACTFDDQQEPKCPEKKEAAKKQ